MTWENLCLSAAVLICCSSADVMCFRTATTDLTHSLLLSAFLFINVMECAHSPKRFYRLFILFYTRQVCFIWCFIICIGGVLARSCFDQVTVLVKFFPTQIFAKKRPLKFVFFLKNSLVNCSVFRMRTD